MVLTEQQQQDVRQWLAEGASLADVQKRLLEEHQVSMTYMEVRLMVLELGATVQDKPEPKPADEAPDAADDGFDDDGAGDASAGGVSVTIDRVVQAGALASGTVTFPDGVSANWMLDRMGSLGLSNVSQAGYRPSPEDVRVFQMALQDKLASGGY
ncbi:MAG: hypothetical protein GX174_01780 [Lentisphaerae bacterium]|jgi:hypothetical protein|nr:hypothetical protein [Lentisphaerota bacterium]